MVGINIMDISSKLSPPIFLLTHRFHREFLVDTFFGTFSNLSSASSHLVKKEILIVNENQWTFNNCMNCKEFNASFDDAILFAADLANVFCAKKIRHVRCRASARMECL
jgi:hypothetical protein